MLSIVHRIRTALLSVLGLVLALGLLLPQSVQATEKSRTAKKKPVATQTAQRKQKAVRPQAKTSKAVPQKRVLASSRKASQREEARTPQRASRKTAPNQRATAKKSTARQTEVAKKGSVQKKQTTAAQRRQNSSVVASASRMSTGHRLGLHVSDDPLSLSSSVALVMDQKTGEVLFSKNDNAVLPIASLTKLMTGLVIADTRLPMDETITITQADVDTYKGSRSRLPVGTRLTRGELMHLSLMSSENRAAHALGRTFPGGMKRFVSLMNEKARDLGMHDTRFVEPTGLLSQNKSSARDLATLVSVAHERPILRDLSTSPSHQLEVGQRTVEYRNSNRLINHPSWEIGLQKTGYISEAGRCLVMQARVADRELIMVFLDASGSAARAQDAERIRHWVEAQDIVREVPRPQG